MKTSVSIISAIASLVLLPLPRLPATETEFSPTLQFSTGLAGSQNKLTWVAGPPGTRYVIRSSTDASNWRDRAVVETESAAGSWLDPEPAGPRVFYQVVPPVAAVFSVEPAVLAPGAVLVITGQCLPAGSSVVFEIEGIPPVTAPIVVGTDGRMTVTLPPFDLITQPGTGLGPLVRLARVVGPGGATVCVISQTFEATVSGFATFAPTVPPPASPMGMAINEKGLPTGPVKKEKTKSHARMAGGNGDETDEDCGGMQSPGARRYLQSAKVSECKNSIGAIARFGRPAVNTAPSVLPGEVSLQQCDLSLAVPAGPPLAFVRTYTSMNQPESVCGTGWDHSYNVYITPVYDSTIDPEPTRVAVHTGDGRVEVMHRKGAVYVCDGAFRTGVLNPDTSFTLTFADQSRIIFCPLVGAPWQGRVGSIVDRNGVALTCTYTAGGHLHTVSSQFGQSLTFTHDTAGHVTEVEDQTGRSVSLSYFGAAVAGGNEGDLMSVSCPIIPGQAPVRGPETYTYSTGSADPRLNSNLLTFTDGAGRLEAGFIYATQPGTSPYYDRVVACDRFSTDPMDPVMHFSYEFITNSTGGVTGLLCTGIDEVGSVSEMECGRQHLPLRVRNYTTFATPGIPVTSTANRPPAPANPAEPAFLEMSFLWNPDLLCTRLTEPDGLQTRTTYDGDLRPDCPRRERGNARVVTIVSPDASEPPRTVSMEYLAGFGTTEGKKGLNAVNVSLAKNNTAAGTRIRKGMQALKYQYEKGWPCRYEGPELDAAARPGGPIKGALVKCGKNPGGDIGAQDFVAGGESDPTDPDTDGDDLCDGMLRPGGPIKGALVKCGKNPGGDAVDRLGGKLEWMDDWETPVAFCTRLTTTTGQMFTAGYDMHGNCIASTTPIAGSGTVCTYNTLGQRTGETVLNGPGPSFRCSCIFDAATYFASSVVVDPDVNGTGEGLSLTTTCVRNALGLITEVVDPRGNSVLISRNACDQVVSISSPPLGNDPLTAARVVCTQLYDAGGLPFRCELEHRDATGALVASNPYYTGFCVYNSRGLLVMEATEQKPVDVPPAMLVPPPAMLAYFNPKEYTFDHAGQWTSVRTPAASRGQAVDEVCDITWNALGQLSSITTGGHGMPGAVTTEFRLNTVNQVTKVTVRGHDPAVSPTVTMTYDGWRRRATRTDELGTVTSWSYANDGFVTVEVHGTAGDVGGTGPTVLLASGRYRAGSRVFCGVADRTTTNCSPNCQSKEVCGNGIVDLTIEPAHQPFGNPVVGHARSAAFFAVFTSDDVCTAERFAPGSTAPHEIETTTVHYSPAGLKKWVTRNGHTMVFHDHDTAGRTIVTSNPGTVTRTCTLDACGNVTSSTLTAHSTIPGAPSETFTTATTFDAMCRPVTWTDSVGNSKAMARDSLERPTSVTSSGGLTVSIAYDLIDSTGDFASVLTTLPDSDGDGMPDYQSSSVCLGGVCSSITDAAGYTTTFTCDSQNRITRTDFPDGTFETTTFNELGHPVSHVRKNGAIVACDFNYKAQSTRVMVTNLPPGVVPVPPTENVWNGLGHCVQTTEGTSIIVRARDSFGNLLSESQNGHTITHTWNERGCTGTTYATGEQFSEVRNAQGQLLTFSAVSSTGVTLTPPITRRDYLGFACVRDVSRNSVTTTRDFRSDGELSLELADGLPDFSFGGCVRTIVTDSTGIVLENHITRRNDDQCEVQHYRAFADGAAPPSRRQTFTLNARNFVTGCLTEVRLFEGLPTLIESDVSYVLGPRGERLSATGGPNPGLYTSSATAPLFDHQVEQYSTWRNGLPITWTADGDLSHLSRPGGGISLIYDVFTRLREVLDSNGAPIASYEYDAEDRRISSTIASHDPLVAPITTFFLYAGDTCYQELRIDGGILVPEMTFGVASGIRHCIITKNGSTYYPNGGGGSETAFEFPILPAWLNPLEEVPIPDPEMTFGKAGFVWPKNGKCSPMLCKQVCSSYGGSIGDITYIGPCDAQDSTMFTTATAMPFERFAFTDSCQPIFLDGEGLPTGASSSSTGYRWLQPDSAWCPESNLYQSPGGLYSPELGQPVSAHKTKPKEKEVVHKKEYVGHVTLLK